MLADNRMRVVFMGTSPFAVPSLEALADSHDVIAVYTAPDRPSGRGQRVSESAVKSAATARGLDVLQPSTLRSKEAADQIAALRPDVVCVAAYGLIIPPDILALPPHGCVNVHGSLLPRWRGAAPVERAILVGDADVGVSIMRMEEGLDTGPYCTQVSVPIGDRNAQELLEMLADAGSRVLLQSLSQIVRDAVVWTPQDAARATYAEKITPVDVALDPSLAVVAALQRVRASGPSAPSRMALGDVLVTVRAASIVARPDVEPGAIACTGGELVLGFRDGALRLDTIVPAGRKPMEGAAFARGARLAEGARWESPQ